MTSKKNKWNILFPAVSAFLILIFNGLYTTRYYVLNNIMDEYAYVSVGVCFAGSRWSSLTSVWSAYYSYGYPLLLSPFFKVFHHFTAVYYAAMAMNALFLIGSFFLSIIIFRKVFYRLSDLAIMVSCLGITLYSSNIINTKWMWPEAAILFLFWLTSYILLKLTEKPGLKGLMILSCLLIIMYRMHQRTLVISIAALMYLAVVFLKKRTIKMEKEQLIKLGFFILVSVILILVTKLIKNYVMTHFYTDNGSMDINNISGIAGSLVSGFNLAGLKAFVQGAAGKLFYFIYGTIFLGGFGVWHCIKSLKPVLADLVRTERGHSQERSEDISFFFLLAFAGMFLLSVLFMMGGGYSRHDTLIYGRYMEYTYGPILLFGVYELYLNRNRWRLFAILECMGILAAFVVSFVWGHEADTYYKSMFSSSIVYYFFYPQHLLLEDIPYVIVNVRSTIFICILLLIQKRRNRLKWVKMPVAIVICSIVWLINAINYNRTAYVVQNNFVQLYGEQLNSLNRIENLRNIYVVCSDEDLLNLACDASQIKRLQVLLPDKDIKPVNLKDIKAAGSLEDGSVYFIVKSAEYYEEACAVFTQYEAVVDDLLWTAYKAGL